MSHVHDYYDSEITNLGFIFAASFNGSSNNVKLYIQYCELSDNSSRYFQHTDCNKKVIHLENGVFDNFVRINSILFCHIS